MRRRSAVGVAFALGIALTLGACSAPAPRVEAGSTVSVNVATPITSANAHTAAARTAGNADAGYLTSTGFGYYDDTFRLVEDRSFGKAEIVRQDPFTVRYTLADSVAWSDGVPIDATDLLLSWAGLSHALNSDGAAELVDAATGALSADAPADAVYFDAPGDTLAAAASSPPVVRNGGRAIEVRFDHPVAGWQLALAPTIPAHVAAEHALGASAADTDAAKEAVADAILDGDSGSLAELGRFWSTGYALTATPEDDSLLVSAGPYRLRSIDESSAVLAANPRYTGDRAPRVDRIQLRYVASAGDVSAVLQSGELDIARLRIGADFAAASGVEGVTAAMGASSRFEYLELNATAPLHGAMQVSAFRRAFLHAIPRQAIADRVLGDIVEDPDPLDSWVLDPTSPDYTSVAEGNGSSAFDDYDGVAAEQLLQISGVADPEVCILYDPENERRRLAFELIRDSAKELDIRVSDCSSPDWASRLGQPGSYDAVIASWDAARQSAPGGYDALQVDEARTTPLTAVDDELQGLLDRLGREPDAGRRAALLDDLDAALWDSSAGMPLYSLPTAVAVRSSVDGVHPSPGSRSVLWDAWNWRPTGTAAPSPSATPTGG